jgi:hypothetical protein
MVENPTITTRRDNIPEWAKADQASAPDPDAWSPPQQKFVLDLIAERDTSHLTADQQAWLQSLVDGQRQLTKSKASELIEKLLKFPKKTVTTIDGNATTQLNADRINVGVPAGRYAIENEQGELRFYNVWISRDKKRLNVYVLHGPDESDLKYQKTVMSILSKIKAAGIRQCAIRYGMEIGECSNCGRRLTNRISRVLGIGPVCGGRMFGDDFKADVKAARTELKKLGLNPDEEWHD